MKELKEQFAYVSQLFPLWYIRVTGKDGFYSHNINNQCSGSRNALGFISHVDQGAINVLHISPQLQILFIFAVLGLHLLDSDPSKGFTQLYLNR